MGCGSSKVESPAAAQAAQPESAKVPGEVANPSAPPKEVEKTQAASKTAESQSTATTAGQIAINNILPKVSNATGKDHHVLTFVFTRLRHADMHHIHRSY